MMKKCIHYVDFSLHHQIVQENFYVKPEASEMSGGKEYDCAMATH